ncbi:MAG: ABC transporter substrate-binding protein [Gammaproteobacteria bacterium]
MSAAEADAIIHRRLEPYRIGVIKPILMEWNQFAFDEAYERGIINRPVKLIPREVMGSPIRDSADVIDAFYDLAENERVLGIIGMWDTDNALACLPHIEKVGVPTFSMCGSQQYVGQWAFNISNGGMADEPAVVSSWLQQKGYRRIGLLKEPTQIGEEYTNYLRRETRDRGMRIEAEATVDVVSTPEQMKAAFASLKQAGVDAVAYFGLGTNCGLLRAALESVVWDPPRIMGTAFVGAPFSREAALAMDGWVGVDQYHEENRVFQAVLDRFEKKFGVREGNSIASASYDIAHALAIALGRMRTASPAGLRDALETVRRVPACTGAPGTVITFGPHDRRGLHGPDFLILRRAVNGTTVLEGTAPVEPWPHPAR